MMMLGLAEAWWAIVRCLHKPNDERMHAADNLAVALLRVGKNAEAEKMFREVLPLSRKVLGVEHPDTLMTSFNLANALDNQAKYTEAEKIYREVCSSSTLFANNNCECAHRSSLRPPVALMRLKQSVSAQATRALSFHTRVCTQ
jgi:hypothetical protein